MSTQRERELEQTVSRLEQENAALRALVRQQAQIIRNLTERIQHLEARLAKDSHNSGKPPSSDGYAKPKARSLRKAGKHPTGGQKGHEGHTLARTEHPDEVVQHPVTHCQSCGESLAQVHVSQVIKRQVFDLPPQAIRVTEHQAQTKICPCCGTTNKASFPAAVKAPTQYGPHILALAVYLQYGQHLPFERIRTLMQECFGLPISEATIACAAATCHGAIAAGLQEIENHLLATEVTHHDETGMRVKGKLQWMHLMSDQAFTRLWTHERRGGEGINAHHFLDGRTGKVIVHDHWSSYFGFPGVLHALCNAHILRELVGITEKPYCQLWSKDMIALLLEIKEAVERIHPQVLPNEQCAQYHSRFAAIVQQGFQENPESTETEPKKRGRKKRTVAQNLLHRLDDHQAEHLAFMMNPSIPFDNNLAERDVRMVKLQQKISGCFRTEEGAKRFADIRSYISTARKHGQSVLQVIEQALQNEPWIPSECMT